MSTHSLPAGTDQLRQWPSLQRLLASVDGSRHWQTAVIVGSLASGQADAMSDVDVFILVESGAFAGTWEHRHELHGRSVVACWDTGVDRVASGGHKWLTCDLVYFDCKVAEPEAVTLAGPFVVAVGRENLLAGIERRPLPQKRERTWRSDGPKPVAVAYAELKDAVRSLLRSP